MSTMLRKRRSTKTAPAPAANQKTPELVQLSNILETVWGPKTLVQTTNKSTTVDTLSHLLDSMLRQQSTAAQPVKTAPSADPATPLAEFSIVLMGNPGAGKSAILNALGGKFFSGFSAIKGHPDTKTNIVELRNRTVALIDTPGIMDSGREGTISKNLQLLQDELNGCEEALLFFVIKPESGRISAGDYSVLKLLLSNLTRTPRIGLFVTKVASDDMEQLDSTYRDDFVKMLQEADVDTTHLEERDWCILPYHEKKVGFTEEEKKKIRDYVTSFAPAKVEVKELRLSLFMKILEFFRNLFS